MVSGVRVRNTWVTYLDVGDTRPKGWLIPHALYLSGDTAKPARAHLEGPAAYQLDGEVMAHHGIDG